MRGIAYLCFYAALTAAPAFGAGNEPAKPTMPYASADDCAIFVEVGKDKLGWDKTPTAGYDLFPEFQNKKGSVYVVDCPWRALGVPAPTIGNADSRAGFSFSRPQYDAKRVQAKVIYQYFIKGRSPDGQKTSPFIAMYDCTLTKNRGRWQLASCDLRMIT